MYLLCYTSLYLNDLYKIDVARSYNPERCNQINNIFHVLREYQKSTYDHLIEIPYFEHYLNSFEEFQNFKEEEENYK